MAIKKPFSLTEVTGPLFTFLPSFPKSSASLQALLSIPHSGEIIPEEFLPYLSGDLTAYQEDVDFKVHECVHLDDLRAAGVSIIFSHIHRVAVDLNRSPEKSVLHWEKNTKGKTIRTKDPSDEKKLLLQKKYYDPYFEVIKSFIQQHTPRLTAPSMAASSKTSSTSQSKLPVVDLHSMPSRPTDYHLKINPHQKKQRPDFCLSDLRGHSCDPNYIKTAYTLFEKYSYKPTINDPYFGGYVTEYVHHFPTNVIQIEINRALYMDEEKKQLIEKKISTLRDNLTKHLIDLFTQFS
jgi:N-formylglutamate amidohydrolase